MGITGLSGLSTQLAGYLNQLQDKQKDGLSVDTDVSSTNMSSTSVSATQTDSVTISSVGYAKSQGMIGINSVGSDTTDSSYIDEHLAGASAQLSLKNSMNSSLESSMKSTMDSVQEAALWNSPGMHTVMMMKSLGASFQQTFKDLQDNVDQQIAKAQEANTGNSAFNGQGTTSVSTESTSADTAQTQNANVQGTTSTSTESASADTAQTQDATAQGTTSTPTENVSTGTAQVSDANVGSDGGTQATAAPSSISITV
jgi:hypothetical protein